MINARADDQKIIGVENKRIKKIKAFMTILDGEIVYFCALIELKIHPKILIIANAKKVKGT
jgi:hypothetical protein